MAGKFSLRYEGLLDLNNGEISYDVGASVLQGYIRSISGFEKVEVERMQPSGVGYNTTWIIYYKGINQAIPNVILNGA